MEDRRIRLSNTDMRAVELKDSNYINNKGAKLYENNGFAPAVEYYRLAAAMGNVHSISNLGYCYLYGRDVEQDLSMAIAYFTVAGQLNDVDALYKLGDIYGSDKWGIKDTEMSVYYYRLAASLILDYEWDEGYILDNSRILNYPSLAFALGRETGKDGAMVTDLDMSYQFLYMAVKGYEIQLANGSSFYAQVYEDAKEYLEREEYQQYKVKYAQPQEQSFDA